MKIKILGVLAAAALALLSSGAARAQCPAGDVTLDNTNVTGFDVTVCLTVSGDTVTLDGSSNNLGLTVVGISKLGVENDVTLSSYSDSPTTWAEKTNPPNNISGFGDFYEFDGTGPASTCGSPTNPNCSWTFSGAPGDNYVVLVRYGNDCSAYVSNLTTRSISPDTNCTVPEPNTLTQLGGGLLGIAGLFLFRRRLPFPSASA
jgi:hypothetical protein